MTKNPAVVAFLETRTGERLGKLIARLGATPLHAPALNEEPDVDPAALAAWLQRSAGEPDVIVVFQTGVGAAALFTATERLGRLDAFRALLERALVLVRGPKPTAVLRSRDVRIDRSAEDPYTTAQVLAALSDVTLAGRAVYVQRYGAPNAELTSALRAGGARVEEIASYRWSLPADTAPLAALLDGLAAGTVDTLLVTSAVQVHNLLAFAREAGREAAVLAALARIPILSVGPASSAALHSHGLDAAEEASPPKLGPLLALLERRLGAAAGPQAVTL